MKTIEPIEEVSSDEERDSPTETISEQESEPANTKNEPAIPSHLSQSNPELFGDSVQIIKPAQDRIKRPKHQLQVETISEDQIETVMEDADETPKATQSADEHLNKNGVFMAPKKPDPPSTSSAKPTDKPTPTQLPPKTPEPRPPPDAAAQPRTKLPPEPSPPPDAAAHPTNESTPTTTPPETPETSPPPDAETAHPIRSRASSWTSNLTKGIRQLEIWHQRMGHPSPTALQRTQKCVEGVPKTPDASPMFHCRFCNQTKQHEAARGKPESNDACLPGTMFHMDLGFFRGPSNLNKAAHHGAQPSDTTIIKSIDGHVACLTIVDAATRKHWTFPLKSKHPPIAIVEKFLNQRGTKRSKQSIKTSPNGFLAQSQMFEHLCQRNGFDFDTSDKLDDAINLETIMSDLPPQQRIV
jgi:hypothetical protein